MIDLDAIKNRLAAVHAAGVCGTTVRLPDHAIQLLVRHALMQGNTAHEAHGAVTYLFSNAPADIAALVEEVERLRARRVYEEGRNSERAAVVAWLYRQHYDDTAERIERGEHRRGEGE